MGGSSSGSMGSNSKPNDQVYFDQNTNQYYTQPAQQNYDAPMMDRMNQIGMGRSQATRNYLNNMPDNNQSQIAMQPTPYNYIDINALFPQLMQGTSGNQSATGLLGDSSAMGATQSASSGAGRFM